MLFLSQSSLYLDPIKFPSFIAKKRYKESKHVTNECHMLMPNTQCGANMCDHFVFVTINTFFLLPDI